MTPVDGHKNDTKLLFGVAALVAAGAVGIAILAGMTLDETPPPDRAAVRPAEATRSPRPLPPPTATTVAYEPATETAVATVVAEAPAADSFRIDPEANFVARGLEHWNAREFDRAAAYFAAESDARPQRAWTQYMLGLSLWKDGRPDEAVAALEMSAGIDPGSIKTLVNLSRVQNDRGDFEAALEAARAAQEIDEHDPAARFLEGRSLFNLERTEEAIGALKASLEIDPDNGYVQNLLGLAYLRDERPEDAIEPLRLAVELRPTVAYIHNNLGMALELGGEPAEAVAAYRAAVDADASHTAAVDNLARLEPTIPPAAVDPAEVMETVVEAEEPPSEDGEAGAAVAIAEAAQDAGPTR